MKRDLSAGSPARFDAFELAETGGALAGEIDPGRLPRLAERVASGAGASDARIAWRIVGSHDPLGHPALRLVLQGTVVLVCQRCLHPLPVAVAQDTELLLARDEPELERLDAGSEAEAVLASEALDGRDLVEDELLLSLPFSPRHADGECVVASLPTRATTAAASPFAGLAGIKTGRPSRR